LQLIILQLNETIALHHKEDDESFKLNQRVIRLRSQKLNAVKVAKLNAVKVAKLNAVKIAKLNAVKIVG
jgi:hypothetical protein